METDIEMSYARPKVENITLLVSLKEFACLYLFAFNHNGGDNQTRDGIEIGFRKVLEELPHELRQKIEQIADIYASGGSCTYPYASDLVEKENLND